MPLTLIINGQLRSFEELKPGSKLDALLVVLALKPDRIALELNGQIAPRSGWSDQELANNDAIELVHFVGGGAISKSKRSCMLAETNRETRGF
jgi:sulfur carrier protein